MTEQGPQDLIGAVPPPLRRDRWQRQRHLESGVPLQSDRRSVQNLSTRRPAPGPPPRRQDAVDGGAIELARALKLCRHERDQAEILPTRSTRGVHSPSYEWPEFASRWQTRCIGAAASLVVMTKSVCSQALPASNATSERAPSLLEKTACALPASTLASRRSPAAPSGGWQCCRSLVARNYP